MSHPYVIIGGDAAGMSAASKIKRNEPDAQVIVFERTPNISYSACGMPYWIAGVIESGDDLVILTPDKARSRRGIDVRIYHEVNAINPSAQTVAVRNLEDGTTFTQPYARLVIGTGASAVKPPIPGLDLPGVFTLRALGDGQRIFQFMADHDPQRAVIVGGGYIGVEMAEALRARGLAVTLVEMLPQIMPNFDADMVGDITAHLAEQGVAVLTERRVRAIELVDEHLCVEIVDASASLQESDVTDLPADLVLISTGVRPNVELARSAGIHLGQTGAIWVDEQMRTSEPAIYAAGDCVEHRHLVLEENAWIPLATSANKGGRVAGDNASGGNSTFPGILGTAIVKVFDYTMAVTGLTEGAARASGKFARVGSAITTSHEKSVYWPGADKMTVKLVFDQETGRVLGGQLVGKDGGKRIDVIATAITARLTVADLAMLDLAYAPPYAPTYDPIHICAAVAAKQG